MTELNAQTILRLPTTLKMANRMKLRGTQKVEIEAPIVHEMVPVAELIDPFDADTVYDDDSKANNIVTWKLNLEKSLMVQSSTSVETPIEFSKAFERLQTLKSKMRKRTSN